jgi:hypothetical protein
MILGTYADLKIIKTRSVVQIVVEVPLERGKEVTDLLGLPQPSAEIPVVVARMDADKIAERSNVVQIEDHRPASDDMDDEPHTPPRPLSQIAGILCNSGAFQCFIQESSDGWDHRPTTDEAAEWLRGNCGVTSRSQLNTDPTAALRFKKIRAEYEAWRLVA